MPIYDIPVPEKEPTPPKAEITTPTYKHSIVDSKKTPVEAPAAWIGGSNWYVDYYTQNHGGEEESHAFDPEKLIAYQSYNKIIRMILKLQGGVSVEDITDRGRMSATGTALVPPNPGIIPEENDTFIADIGEGTAGLFTIDSVRKLSLNAATAYEISFRLARIATEKLVKQLDAKVVETYYYDRDTLILGQNPLVLDSDYHASRTLDEHYNEIAAIWVASNISYTHNTFVIPNQKDAVYDPYVVRAMLKLVTTTQHKDVKEIREYNVDDYRIPKYVDIYSAVMQRAAHLIYRCFTEYITIQYSALGSHPLQNGIRWSGIRYGVVPAKANLDADAFDDLFKITGIGGPSIELTSGKSANQQSIRSCPADINEPCDIDNVPMQRPVMGEEDPLNPNPVLGVIGMPGLDIPSISSPSYVLSPAFYKRSLPECTKFERLLWDILEGKQTNYQDVYPFCKSFTKWGRLEQFYLGPLLLMLIRNAIRSI